MDPEQPSPIRVLVADDEEDMLKICVDVLESQVRPGGRPSEIRTVSNGVEAQHALLREKLDLIVLDVQMPGVSGLDLMHFALEHGRGAPVVLITAYPNYSDAVTAVKEGAFDYIVKPFTASQLAKVAMRALEDAPVRTSLAPGLSTIEASKPTRVFLGESPKIRELRKFVRRIAPLNENVVLLGETGTGKGLLASVLHRASPGAGRPIITLDCGAIPRELMESELFGHEKGAFTGATTARQGLLELAEDGTLFLDEVSEIPLELQSRLLRALHEREFRRVGGSRLYQFRGRVIAASNRDLEEEVAKGRFRDDLFYRLHVIPVHLPPLREHPEDIPLLATAFLTRFGEKNPTWRVRSISPEALRLLGQYRWPGNVRELENVIRRTAAVTDGEEIRADDLPEEIRSEPTARDLTEGEFDRAKDLWLSRFEERYFRDLLEQTTGNVVEAARCSGVPRATLYRYLHKHNLDPANFRVTTTGQDPTG